MQKSSLLNAAKQKYECNKNLIFLCVISTFIVGLITHAYMFAQDSFSHDSLKELNGLEYANLKIQAGRFLIPVYKVLTRGWMTSSWLIGIYSLLWISAAVFLTVKLFDIRGKQFPVMVSLIYTANLSVIATTATYIHDLDVDMFALLMSVLAAFAWCKIKRGYFISVTCIFIVLSLYQCYISVTLTLIIVFYIIQLLKEATFKVVFFDGLKFLTSTLISGILYFVTFKTVLLIGNINVNSRYNTLDNMFSGSLMETLKNTFYAYVTVAKKIMHPSNIWPRFIVFALTLIIAIPAVYILLRKLSKNEIKIKEKILVILLVLCLPLAMNISHVLSNGVSHDLMYFAFWIVYVFALVLLYNAKNFNLKSTKPQIFFKYCKCICILAITIIFIGNISLANKLYLKKDLEQEATLSLLTRIVDKIDSINEFDREQTPVVFVGKPEYFNHEIPGFENNLIGGSEIFLLDSSGSGWYQSYFEHILHYKITVINCDATYLENEIVKSMPLFPKNDSIQMINDVLVVKLGEPNSDDLNN